MSPSHLQLQQQPLMAKSVLTLDGVSEPAVSESAPASPPAPVVAVEPVPDRDKPPALSPVRARGFGLADLSRGCDIAGASQGGGMALVEKGVLACT